MYIRNVDDFLSILKWIANTSLLHLRLKLYKKEINLTFFVQQQCHTNTLLEFFFLQDRVEKKRRIEFRESFPILDFFMICNFTTQRQSTIKTHNSHVLTRHDFLQKGVYELIDIKLKAKMHKQGKQTAVLQQS